MQFIGQEHIIEQLGFLIPEVQEGAAKSFLLRGPSGYGKTDLAMRIATALSGTEYTLQSGDNLSFNPDIRVHVVDEIQECPRPPMYYPLIDCGDYVFIFTTNSDSNLPEAFINRCVDLIFTDYSIQELRTLVIMGTGLRIDHKKMDYLIEFCNRNPRILLNTAKRLVMWKNRYCVDLYRLTMDDFKIIAERVFGIVDGLDIQCQRYLRTLKELGGRASLATLKSAMHLDANTLRYQIEPALLHKNLVKITNKGRELCETI